MAQARHHFKQYATLLWDELGIHPSAALTERVGTACGGPPTSAPRAGAAGVRAIPA